MDSTGQIRQPCHLYSTAWSHLYKLAPISDPSDKLIEVHLAALKWHMQQHLLIWPHC